jgi:Flp pilus assembly protein TadG
MQAQPRADGASRPEPAAVHVTAAAALSVAGGNGSHTTRALPAHRRPGVARRWRGDRGAGAAETVIAVPLLMLLILLIVQFAIWAHASAVAQATAEEALAAARVQGGSAAAGQQRATQVLGQIGSSVLLSPQVSVTRTGAIATVQITGTAEEVLPVPGLSFPVRITVTGPVERFVPATEQG